MAHGTQLFAHISQRKLLVLSVSIVVILNAAWFTPFRHWVKAQIAGQTLEIIPPTQEITANPGEAVTVTSRIRNGGNDTLPVKVVVQGFVAEGVEGQVALTSDNPYSVAAWTRVQPAEFDLEPGEERSVRATISVPKNAAGGRYGSFVFSVTPSGESAGRASVSQQIASLFLLRISGPATETLKLTDFSAPKFQEFGPVPFRLTFQNEGNVHVKVYGLINVRDMFGKNVEDVVLTGHNIFPEAERVAEVYLGKRILFGKYTATAIMYYGSANDVITKEVTFYVFPLRIAVAFVIFIIFIYLLRKRLGKALRALGGK